jgi:acyl dehydratase
MSNLHTNPIAFIDAAFDDQVQWHNVVAKGEIPNPEDNKKTSIRGSQALVTQKSTSSADGGIFRRETKGMCVEPVVVQLERGRLTSFARLLAERDPIFLDPAAARAMHYPDVVASPSFPSTIEMLAKDERYDRGVPNLTDLVGCDYRFLLHGEQHYSYLGLMYAGDEVTVSGEVLDFYDKKGGLLEFVVLGSTISHPERGVLVRARRTLVHRLVS